MPNNDVYVLNTNPRLLNVLLADALPQAKASEQLKVAVIGAGMAGLSRPRISWRDGVTRFTYTRHRTEWVGALGPCAERTS
jgi:hypothetical protein